MLLVKLWLKRNLGSNGSITIPFRKEPYEDKKMKIETKMIQDNEGNTSIRYFSEKIGSFDGTAGGWGYKSKQKLMKAYWYHQNKHKINGLKLESKKFLKEKPRINRLLKNYFDEDNYLDAWKCGETLTFKIFISALENDDGLENKAEIIDILKKNKYLWATLEKEI